MVDYSDLISTNIFAIPLLFDTIVFFILYCKKQGLKRDKVIIDLIMLIFLLHTFNYCWDLIQFNCLTQNTEGNFPTFISVLTEKNEQNDSGFLDFVLKSFEFFTKFNLHYKQLLKTTYSMYLANRSVNVLVELFYSYEYLNLILNPLGHGSKRLYFYIFIFMIAIGIGFITGINDVPSSDNLLIVFKIINSVLLLLFVGIGCYILILLGRSIQVEKFKTKRGIQRIFYTHIIYMICYCVLAISDILFQSQGSPEYFLVILNVVLEIVIGFLRLNELKIWRFKCKCLKNRGGDTNINPYDSANLSSLLPNNQNHEIEMNTQENDKSFSSENDVVLSDNFDNKEQQTLEETIMEKQNQTFSDYFLKSLISESFQHILEGLTHIISNNSKIKSISNKEYSKVFKHTYALKSMSIESTDEMTLTGTGMSNILSMFSNKNIFLEYAPVVFGNLRLMGEIKESKWKESFNVLKNKENISKIAISEGKSSSFFFFTHDNKYIIKTIPEREIKTFMNVFLQKYYEHNIENNNTLLVRIYGLFTFKSGLTKINLMVMENIAPFKTNQILYKFDLKGSLVGRETQNLFQNRRIKALKDQDFLDLCEHNSSLICPKKADIAVIPEIIKGDIKVLANSNLMDYSLLIAIIDKNTINNENNDEEEESLYGLYKKVESENGKYMYYFGIIDYLTEFNFRKTLENSLKNLFVSQSEKNKFSAIKPGPYQARFFDFIRTNVFVKVRDKRLRFSNKNN